MNHLIWSNVMTAWLCGLISSDGTIVSDKKHTIIVISYSSERQWLEQIQTKLLKEKIQASLTQERRKKKPTLDTKEIFILRLNKRVPKGRHNGLNQYQALRNSIEYWSISKLIMKRKYEKLCEFTQLGNEIMMKQRSL